MTTADTVSTVVPSPWPDLDIPDVPLTAFLLGAAARRPDHPAVVDAATGRSLTYGDFAHQIERAAAGFAAEGLGKGDVVAILSPNSPEWLVACHGAIAAGGVVSGLNPLWSADEVAAQIHDSAARFLVTTGPLAATARAAAEKAGVGTRLVLLDGQAPANIAPAHRPARLPRPGPGRRDRPGGRPRAAALLQRHHRPAQGCDAHPPRVHRQRAADRRRAQDRAGRPHARRRPPVARRRLGCGRQLRVPRRGDGRHPAPVRAARVPRGDPGAPDHPDRRGAAGRARAGPPPRGRRVRPVLALPGWPAVRPRWPPTCSGSAWPGWGSRWCRASG